MSQQRRVDVVIVGAGFAGLYALYKMRALGLSAQVFELGDGVGGTWYWNRYPGARCDVESMQYSYQFSDELQQEWEWSERYSPQAEILRYLDHVADRFDLRRDIQFETRVTAAVFHEETGRWTVETDRGDRLSARFCIMATGCLSSTNLPDFPGLDDFEGAAYHTGRWPHGGVDFSGKRVGIIGTGSSAIQATPLIAEEAAHLTVFQRTPNFTIPARNAPMDPGYQRSIKEDYARFRALCAETGFGLATDANPGSALEVGPDERREEYERRWALGGLGFITSYADLLRSREANETAAEFIREKIRETVQDQEVAELLSPDHVVGCKRPCVDTGYWETFNRENVSLVDAGGCPIERITAKGLVTGGVEHELDVIVFATGFDAMTGALLNIDIRGREGQTLQDKWFAGPRTYLGLQTAAFPNLFTITGPGSPSVLSNMVPSIEQHVNWIAACLEWMREGGVTLIEATEEAEDAWVAHVNEVADETLYPTCNSWYLGANVPGKPRVFMPYLGFPVYVEKCNEIAANGYEGFAFTPDARGEAP